MNENDAQEVLEEGVTTCADGEVDIIKAGPKDPRKRLYAEKLEEELEKVKGQRDQVMEEIRIGQAQKSQLENQFVGADQSRKVSELKIIASDEMLQTFRRARAVAD
ncbi:hypothetical protein NL676_030551 [Syzygium grande]|nr:hypothetical protein NL676_030551 [Syzygium grande]